MSRMGVVRTPSADLFRGICEQESSSFLISQTRPEKWLHLSLKMRTTLNCLVLTRPVIPVCFGLAAEDFCISITAVMSVATPID